ncbi:MAG TPA: M15 family metallopeptidase [Chloroflexota bacterium]|nr:M15 family metallopeptidase [Chloroflexota bacterium]
MKKLYFCLLGLMLLLVVMGCRPVVTAVAPPPITPLSSPAPEQLAMSSSPTPASSPPSPPHPLTPASAPHSPAHSVTSPPASPTAVPTSTHTPTPTNTATPTPTPTATAVGPCPNRLIAPDDLWAIVTQSYGLSRDYAPTDLVSLNDYLGNDVTLGYPIELRAIMVESLVQMVADMQAAGLQPQILSGYRSYSAQSIAYNKWASEFPGHVNIISAPPGYSEHQLGTTIDFGSPELPLYTGDPNLQFHTYFYKTNEGIWLLANAHRYGFTLSWPLETFELTGFYYEPWHYRYVGVEMATTLHEMGLSLTQFQLANQPEPCVP